MLAPRARFELATLRLAAETAKNLSALSGVAYKNSGAIFPALAAPNPAPKTHGSASSDTGAPNRPKAPQPQARGAPVRSFRPSTRCNPISRSEWQRGGYRVTAPPTSGTRPVPPRGGGHDPEGPHGGASCQWASGWR